MLGTIPSPGKAVAYILFFGVGFILGMMAISTLIGLPFAFSSRRLASLNHTIRLLAGGLSLVLGLLVMVQIGFMKGLFHGV